jgi:Icc-related predicted phosphoesterase
MRIAAIADFHCRVNSAEIIRPLLEGLDQVADVLLIPGDLTDTGLPNELEVLLNELQALQMTKIAVLGNHDHESDKAGELVAMLQSEGIVVLDGGAYEIGDVGFVGTKGFCGGFDTHFVQPFGERALKEFIQVSLNEAVNLENALTKLSCSYKVAISHYAPIKGTLEGEPLELYPFLGSSRLANVMDRQGVNVIFHGHAHHGCLEGRTPGNIPVFNVSRFARTRFNQSPFCLFEI